VASPRNFLALATALAALSLPVAAQVAYSPGFVWDRTMDWRDGTAPGTSNGNPSPDALGSKVWRYEYTTGKSFSSATPWYLSPKTLMVWDDYWWGTASQSNWARGYLGGGSDNNVNPPITKYTLVQDLSEYKKSLQYLPVARWFNPVAGYNEFSITGDMQVEWAGWGVSPNVDVEVAILKKDSVTQQVYPVWLQTFSNPTPGYPNPPYPKVTIPLNISMIRFNKDDQLMFTLRAKKEVEFVQPAWVVLYDNARIKLLRQSVIAYEAGN
jgi:hypothetical protein